MKQKKNNKEPGKKIAGISKTGKKVIFSGIFMLIIGYFVLTKTDPMGQNLASMISPFLILGGYVLIGVGIIIPDKQPQNQ
jgi:hypothetical protein